MNAAYAYLVAVGSNRRHPRIGSPRKVVAAAINVLDESVGNVVARSPIIASDPVGPSQRRYANAALVLESEREPPSLLRGLQDCEAAFGRTRTGQRWRERVLDLDIVLWSSGIFASPDLVIPHPLFRTRNFVVGPAATVAPTWRDPVSGLTLRQLAAHAGRARRMPRPN